MVQEGYEKFNGHAFKIPTPSKWIVVVSGREMVEDIRRATEDQLSFRKAVMEQLQVRYTMGWEDHFSDYQIDTVRVTLTRNIGPLFPAVRDEIQTAFTDEIPVKDDWVKIKVLETMMRIVSRITNRAFVGLPLCRDPDYRQLNIQFTIDVFGAAIIVNRFPNWMKPMIATYLTNTSRKLKQGINHLKPILEERLAKEAEFGKDWPGKPNDLISWLIDDAPKDQKTIRHLAIRVMLINIAAIHTTSMAFTSALYNLVARPAIMEELREEIEPVIEEEGWSKNAMSRLRKLDSFLKESLRLYGVNAVNTDRKVLKDFTFSNGTKLPAGCHVAVASYPTHLDSTNYPAATEFQSFRYIDEEGVKQQMATPSLIYHAFGNGRNVCPGRYFAANELKAMVAHVLMTYDVKFAKEQDVPKAKWFAVNTYPDPSVEVMFKRRTTA